MKNDRFIIESNGIWDKEKGEEQLTWRELCNLLNELYIENKELNEIIHVICDIDLYGENESVKELISLRHKSTIQKELKDLKKEYENELLKLKRKVSDFDTSVVMWENQKLREENKKLKEQIEIYEKCIS